MAKTHLQYDSTWMSPLSNYANDLRALAPSEWSWLVQKMGLGLHQAGGSVYAHWLLGRLERLPSNWDGQGQHEAIPEPSIEIETVALQIILPFLRRIPPLHELELKPGQIDGLNRLRRVSLKAVKDRILEIERDDGKPTHSDDFTCVIWYGTKHEFSKGLQAESVRVLWEAWANRTPILSEKTIGEKAGSSANHFRLEHVFKPIKKRTGKRVANSAWGTMIKSAGKGLFTLSSP